MSPISVRREANFARVKNPKILITEAFDQIVSKIVRRDDKALEADEAGHSQEREGLPRRVHHVQVA